MQKLINTYLLGKENTIKRFGYCFIAVGVLDFLWIIFRSVRQGRVVFDILCPIALVLGAALILSSREKTEKDKWLARNVILGVVLLILLVVCAFVALALFFYFAPMGP
jgi:small-conductance mechanosensitive channel